MSAGERNCIYLSRGIHVHVVVIETFKGVKYQTIPPPPRKNVPTQLSDVVLFYRRLLTYKPQGSKVTLDIMSADVECLDPGEHLNDKIIDFYLK